MGLPATFSLNDYNNWVPCHERCNKSKSDSVFKAAPMILSALEKLVAVSNNVRAIETQIAANKNKTGFLEKL